MRNTQQARQPMRVFLIGISTLFLAACGSVAATTPTATLAPRPTDVPIAADAPTAAALLQPTSAPVSQPTARPESATDSPNAKSILNIGELETYTYKTGLFTIQIPVGWQHTESSTETVSASWVAPDNTGGIFIGLKQSSDTLTQEQLIEFGNAYVQTVFGTENSFQSESAVPQKDGSVLIPFGFNSALSGTAINMVGLTYMEQRGDKVSGLTVLFPDAQSEQLWASHFETIVNSYKIDQSVKIP